MPKNHVTLKQVYVNDVLHYIVLANGKKVVGNGKSQNEFSNKLNEVLTYAFESSLDTNANVSFSFE